MRCQTSTSYDGRETAAHGLTLSRGRTVPSRRPKGGGARHLGVDFGLDVRRQFQQGGSAWVGPRAVGKETMALDRREGLNIRERDSQRGAYFSRSANAGWRMTDAARA